MSYTLLLVECDTPWSVLGRSVLSQPSQHNAMEEHCCMYKCNKCAHKIHNWSDKKELVGQHCCHFVQIKTTLK